MAKTNVSDKQEKPNFFQKIGRFFKNLFLKIVRSFKDMYAELKKVTWPTRKELINYSLVVVAFMAVMAVVVGLIDGGAALLVKWIVGT